MKGQEVTAWIHVTSHLVLRTEAGSLLSLKNQQQPTVGLQREPYRNAVVETWDAAHQTFTLDHGACKTLFQFQLRLKPDQPPEANATKHRGLPESFMCWTHAGRKHVC